mmetsp:Transcript_65453/g.182161  ORF Transcript_65453/g.182161 Transcript_65453/m.182161 type:complete len:207 (-) Transcript_65453:1185-1805(-)
MKPCPSSWAWRSSPSQRATRPDSVDQRGPGQCLRAPRSTQLRSCIPWTGALTYGVSTTTSATRQADASMAAASPASAKWRTLGIWLPHMRRCEDCLRSGVAHRPRSDDSRMLPCPPQVVASGSRLRSTRGLFRKALFPRFRQGYLAHRREWVPRRITQGGRRRRRPLGRLPPARSCHHLRRVLHCRVAQRRHGNAVASSATMAALT